MANWRATIKDFIAAVEFEGREPTMTISRVDEEEVFDEKTGKEKIKLTAHFRETKRGWVLNTTNCLLMEEMFGSGDSKDWIGKRVTLVAADVQLGKEMVKGIRIKGSPDLKEPITVRMKVGRKKITVRLVPTGKDAPPSKYEEQPTSKLREMAEEENVEVEREEPAGDEPADE